MHLLFFQPFFSHRFSPPSSISKMIRPPVFLLLLCLSVLFSAEEASAKKGRRYIKRPIPPLFEEANKDKGEEEAEAKSKEEG